MRLPSFLTFPNRVPLFRLSASLPEVLVSALGQRNTSEAALRRCAQVLGRPIDLLTKLTRGAEWPVRIAQKLTREQNTVRLSARDDLVRLSGIGDEADGASGDARLATDALRERHLIARAKR